MELLDILSALEEHFPTRREVRIEGYGRPLFVHRLELPQLIAISQLPRETDSDLFNLAVELVAISAGSEDKPGAFDSDRGRRFLRLNPLITTALSNAVNELNELNGASSERKNDSSPIQ